ncbi:hypothetical protein Taro_046497 [Colocasia esculenta]|uniref:RNase H type-1 domain-containing protein n=1 Tax=Colocasia esculenta TaxID=4460 RepID=A0A843WSK7_COLES|nr:hypothetical protein [Colocasia esculenta]
MSSGRGFSAASASGPSVPPPLTAASGPSSVPPPLAAGSGQFTPSPPTVAGPSVSAPPTFLADASTVPEAEDAVSLQEGGGSFYDSTLREANITVRANIMVRGIPPEINLSLNVDGACKGNPDSAILVRAIIDGKLPHWAVFPGWQGICHMLQIINPKIVHTFREGNQVADALASLAYTLHRNLVFISPGDLPPPARGALLIDKAGLPSFRHSH